MAVGQGVTNDTIENTDSATIGNSDVITASGDVTLQAISSNNVVASSDSNGGGVVKFAKADTTVSIFPYTQVSVGNSAQINAGSEILVDSQTHIYAENVTATADGGGLGVNAESDSELDLTTPGDSNYAYTETTIGTNAALAAQNAIVQAVVSYGLVSLADSTAAAFGAKGQATAAANAEDTSLVTIMPGATITGTNLVDIEARHDNLVVSSTANCDAKVAFGQAFATSTTNVVGPSWFNSSDPDVSEIIAAPGATIVTPNLQVSALVTFDEAVHDSHAYGGFIVGHYNYEKGQILANRTIHWNANVVSGGGNADTTLIVNADGSVNPASNITPTITPTQIIVPDIGSAGASGAITFQANDISNVDVTNNSAPGLIDGNQATFFYSLTSGAVELLNYSTKELVVNNIGALSSGSGTPNVDINVLNDNALNDAFAFNVSPQDSSTSVDIENLSTTSARKSSSAGTSIIRSVPRRY